MRKKTDASCTVANRERNLMLTSRATPLLAVRSSLTHSAGCRAAYKKDKNVYFPSFVAPCPCVTRCRGLMSAPIVADIGECWVRVGFAGEHAPRAVFRHHFTPVTHGIHCRRALCSCVSF